jgi:hypothetical protein
MGTKFWPKSLSGTYNGGRSGGHAEGRPRMRSSQFGTHPAPAAALSQERVRAANRPSTRAIRNVKAPRPSVGAYPVRSLTRRSR